MLNSNNPTLISSHGSLSFGEGWGEVRIREASSLDFPIIQNIAHQTWPETYGQILSKVQLDFMLNKFYALDYLQLNLNNNHIFYIIEENEIPIGFIGIEHNCEGKLSTKIHKIYILSNNQGKGIGKLAIDFVMDLSKQNNSKTLILNVNRFNKAIVFYQKMDFKIIQEVNIEIGNGYLMEDFVMQKIF